MKKHLVKFILTLSLSSFSMMIFFSCKNENEQATLNKNILPKETMVNVLYDLTLIEATFNLNLEKSPILHQDQDTMQRFNIYQLHHITRIQYETSIAYYARHPQEFKLIYEEVLERLNKQKQQ